MKILVVEDEKTIAEPLSAAQEKLATRHQRIDIPAADATQFLAAFLPPLQRTVRVVVDDDVDVPEVRPPIVTLQVRYEPGHITELSWGFRYQIDDDFFWL